MSRSGYSDSYGDEYPGQLELYRANVERSIKGKRGQARLIELRDALEAMPVKELAVETFLAPTGEACALGVWADRYTKADAEVHAIMQAFEGDDTETAELLGPLGWPRLVVRDLIYQNDDGNVWHAETRAERHARVSAWVNEHIVADVRQKQAGGE